jgi:hypothetical protein
MAIAYIRNENRRQSFRAKQKGAASAAPFSEINVLWSLNQLQLAFFCPVKNIHSSFFIAEHEYIAIAELALFNRFLNGHGT